MFLSRLFYRLFFIINLAALSSLNARANESDVKYVLGDITKIYMSSMVYIFKEQKLINQRGGNKEKLFGVEFVNNVKMTYKNKYLKPFPEIDHKVKESLLKSMIEVMEDNRELINDDQLDFKGIIPAIFAFQLSAKLSTKGVGLKIKFTRTEEGLRNELNKPDSWETKVMKQIIVKPQVYYDENASIRGKPAYRQFTPLPMAPYCLKCHGVPAQNPVNFNKNQSDWTDIDMTGFKMEGWTMEDFGGGISISIEKSVLNINEGIQ
jgi:hypothetical protein